jgi:predicted house-cleaning noncanonical NTP pyrophosphatase (MazG superfamily)
LKKKLVEEAIEVQECDREDMLKELSDVLELIKSIAKHYEIPFNKVKRYQKIKREIRGSFKRRIFLIWSSREQGKVN